MPSVYLETSFFRYLIAPPSTEAVKAKRQRITKQWWDTSRKRFQSFVSQAVYDEFWLASGVPAAEVHNRLAVLQETELLSLSGGILEIAHLLIEPAGPLPRRAGADAVHWAVAAFYACDYVLTWNFRHLNNAEIKRRAERILIAHGYDPPTVCSPEELT